MFSTLVIIVSTAMVLCHGEEHVIEMTPGEPLTTIESPKEFQPGVTDRFILKTQPGNLIDVYCHTGTMNPGQQDHVLSCDDFSLVLQEGSTNQEHCGKIRTVIYKSKTHEITIEARYGTKHVQHYYCHFEAVYE